MPLSAVADVPDEMTARLVVLGVDHPFSRRSRETRLWQPPRRLPEARGNSPRVFRNTLVFLAVDETRLQDLDEAVRRYLAWKSIVDEKSYAQSRSTAN